MMLYNLRKEIYSNFARKSKQFSRKDLYSDLIAVISSLPDGSSILNIGSGGEVENVIVSASKRKNLRIVSVDIDINRGPDIVADVCTMPFESESWDVVILIEVLEHVKEPWKAIAEIFRVLRTDGKLVLTTPFIYPIHEVEHDYYRYTKHGLRFLLKEFKEVSVTERNNYIETINVLLVRSIADVSERARFLALVSYYSGFCFISSILWAGISSRNLTTGYRVLAVK
jgi:ubiquinone/menaquinone biosynthesis C-methylase UbiE